MGNANCFRIEHLLKACFVSKLAFFLVFFDWELGEEVLAVFNMSKTGGISSSFDQKVGSSALESCSRPEKWANRSSSFSNLYTQNLVIDVQDSEPKKKTREKATKEQPIWMSESTVEGATPATTKTVGKF